MGAPVANLLMYARPELSGAHDRLWLLIRAALAEAGIPAPRDLSQSAGEFDTWQSPDLVLSQTCGMPYRLWLHNQVQYVGTPDYGLEGCPPGYYRSALIVRADDPRQDLKAFRDAPFAFNALHSQSGYAAPFNHLKTLGFWFTSRTETGAHRASAQAVAEGGADIAALDAVTWRLIQHYDPFAGRLRVLEWTAPTPGLPLITGKACDADAIFAAVSSAIKALDLNDRDVLGLRQIIRLPKSTYLTVPSPPGDYTNPG